jgi:hypothetical protein
VRADFPRFSSFERLHSGEDGGVVAIDGTWHPADTRLLRSLSALHRVDGAGRAVADSFDDEMRRRTFALSTSRGKAAYLSRRRCDVRA